VVDELGFLEKAPTSSNFGKKLPNKLQSAIRAYFISIHQVNLHLHLTFLASYIDFTCNDIRHPIVQNQTRINQDMGLTVGTSATDDGLQRIPKCYATSQRDVRKAHIIDRYG